MVKRTIDRRRTKKKKTASPAEEPSEEDHVKDAAQEEENHVEESDKEDEEEPSPPPKQSNNKKRRSGYLVQQRGKPQSPKKPKPPPESEEESSFHSSSSEEESDKGSAEEYKEEDDESSDSDDDDFIETKRSTASRGQRRTSAKQSRRSKLESSSEEDFEPSPRRKPAPTRGRRRASVTSAGRKGRNKKEASSSSEEEELGDDDYEVMEATPKSKRKRRTASRRSSRRTYQEDPIDSEEEEELPNSTSSLRRITPSRRSAAVANARLSRLENPSDNDEEEEEEEEIIKRPKRKKRSEDDEFVVGDEDKEVESDGDDELDVSAQGEESSLEEKKVGNVDNGNFFTADSSDDENMLPSPQLSIKYGRKRRRTPKEEEDFEEEASLSSVEETQPKSSQSSGPKMPDCPSKEDAVTMEDLPREHICYFAPDQGSRQCFCLGTLHQIAMSSSVRDENGRHTFLQPPHFRTKMSDDLIDQIASRFGRAALEVNGAFYRRNKGGTTINNVLGEFHEEDDLLEHLNRYISNYMGSRDIYCCPVCYVEAHRRLTNVTQGNEDVVKDSDADDSSDDGVSNDQIKLWHDPMTVLGFPDSDDFKLAAAFCFRKVVDVKRHLREDHDIDPKSLDGTHLFQKYKVRTGDGLLQRFIERSFKGHTYQGDMSRYWNAGNNQSFIHLLYLMQRHVETKERVAVGETDFQDEGKALVKNAQDFFESFQNRAKRSWRILSAPFQKVTKEDLKDFVVDDDVEEEENEQSHAALHFEQEVDPDRDIVAALRAKMGRETGMIDLEDESDASQGEEEDEWEEADLEDDASSKDNPKDHPGYYSEEEEEDEWVTQRRPGHKKPSPSVSQTPSSEPKKKRLRRGNAPVLSSAHKAVTPVAASPTSKPAPKSRRVIQESDSE